MNVDNLRGGEGGGCALGPPLYDFLLFIFRFDVHKDMINTHRKLIKTG